MAFDSMPDVAFAGLVGGHAAVSENEAGHVLRREVVVKIFREDQAKKDMLVFRRVHIVPQLVGGEPKFGLEAEGGTSGIGFGEFSGWHVVLSGEDAQASNPVKLKVF